MHGLKSRLLDQQGFGSVHATKALIKQIEEIQPDLIHLHNIHGYYINIEVLFDFLGQADIPVVWTFHDCWPFTGHCSYFDRFACEKWKTECHHCPNLKGYPQSWFVDNSRSNYRAKKALFNSVKDMVIVTPSRWLANHVSQSFLNNYPLKVIHNGIDLSMFKPVGVDEIRLKYKIGGDKMILGVASTWDQRKGLVDFILLRRKLDRSIGIVLVGLNKQQINGLPAGITGLGRTESVTELAALYSAADVFVNPTYIDNFPTTNLEALACGTPVITYNTGGSPEAVDQTTGRVIEKGDVDGLADAVNQLLEMSDGLSEFCRARAERLYDKDDRLYDYVELYERLSVMRIKRTEQSKRI
jgi:glycosyltransferase involved in cell wall biosynthesis